MVLHIEHAHPALIYKSFLVYLDFININTGGRERYKCQLINSRTRMTHWTDDAPPERQSHCRGLLDEEPESVLPTMASDRIDIASSCSSLAAPRLRLRRLCSPARSMPGLMPT